MRQKPALKLQTTSLWYYPSQQYAGVSKGMPNFTGATPSYVIWNLLTRYTREGDLVVDPFCGGGATIDVATELEREVRGFDVAPVRDDITEADARQLPLEDASADFFFMDPPYSTHLEYSDAPNCIGKLDAFDGSYFEAMEDVFREARRCLKDRRYLAVYVSDSFEKKKGFSGIGARLFCALEQHFKPIDHVAVVRGNRTLEKPGFHRAAAEGNYFLRGFNHLLIFKNER